MITFTIEELKEIAKQISEAQCDVFSEYCIVALESSGHNTGCILKVTGQKVVKFRLLWNKVFKRAGYKEGRTITGKAAEAISFFLTKELTEYSIFEEAPIGPGFDFWLGYKETDARHDPLNFMQARLEIAGMKKEDKSHTLRGLAEIKKRQTEASDSMNLPAYVSVVEMATPKALFVKR
jgi:hypothetical protein